MSRKSLLYQTAGKGATFRLIPMRPPKEEVSTWERGIFHGKKISVLSTLTMTRRGSRDYLRGLGMISSGDGSAAYFTVTGVARGTKNFGEDITGQIVYSGKCTGHLGPLSNVKATFQTIVDSKGFRTKVWKIQTKRLP
jgi:hypothetical protein